MKKIAIILITFLASFGIIGCSKNSDESKNIDIVLNSNEIEVYNGMEITISADVNRNDVKAISFYLDGNNIATIIDKPFSIKYKLKDISYGEHHISCLVKYGTNYEASSQISIFLKLRLGDEYQGGRIFQLDESGKSGLIASTQDFSIDSDDGLEYGFSWGIEGKFIGATSSNGEDNTALMAVNAQYNSEIGYYAKNKFEHNGFNDWYIPSYEELELLNENMALVGGFKKSNVSWENYYWSSSEKDADVAFCLNFFALSGNYSEKRLLRKVRLIRSFE